MKPPQLSSIRAAHPVLLLTALLAVLAPLGTTAADRIWDGGGANGFWGNPVNWANNVAPIGGDSLFFTQTVRVNNTNDFGTGASFNGITFLKPAGPFNLRGSQVILVGGITNNQDTTAQTISLPLALGGTRDISVTDAGLLTIGGVVSGVGAGLIKSGGGSLTLSGINTFTGPLTINEGSVLFSSDGNLGGVPGSATPGSIAIDTGGALSSTATLTLQANRGIGLGPTSGQGQGRIEVASGTTLTYNGILANRNSGTGGLTKAGAGTLTISSANTYTGPTSNRVGTLVLDFTQTTSPTENIISSSSSLSLGGENAGIGNVNPIQLTMNGKASTANSQSFASTFLDTGTSVIRANSGTGGSASLTIGALDHSAGGAVAFIAPTITGGAGAINSSSLNYNGILGGFATFSAGTPVINNIPASTNWASMDGTGKIVPYTGFYVYPTGGTLSAAVSGQSNVLINANSTGDARVAADNAGAASEVNSILFTRTAGFTVLLGANNTVRMGKRGGIFKSDATASATYVLTGSGPGGTGNGVQDSAILTAGEGYDTPGDLVFTINSSSQTAGSLNTEATIADNGPNGKVNVIKTGPGPMKFRGHNTFSGNMYILQGRIQMAGTEIGTGNPTGFGYGDIYVLPGGQAYPSGAGSTPITNNWYIAGNGVSDNVGAIRLSGVFSNGIMTLIGDARLGGGGAATGVPIYDRITGKFNLDFGATGNSGGGANGAVIFNQGNDWTGNTTVVGRTGGSAGNTVLRNGASDVIPDGFGKGNLIIGLSGITASTCTYDLNGFNETVNGLSSAGNLANDFIQNGASATVSTLTVGNNDQSSTYGGLLQDAGGMLALTKIGGGVLTLTGAANHSGDTTVNGGTLALVGAVSIASSPLRINSGGTLDLSGLPSPSSASFASITGNGGTLVVDEDPGFITALNLTNARVRAINLSTTTPNLQANTLTTGGATNLIDVVSIGFISGYPAQFPIIKYSGTLQGAGNNFGIGSVPRSDTAGYISNNIATSTIDLVLTSGPKALTWTGANSSNWDIGLTTNWLAFGVTPVAFENIDAVLFNDTSAVNSVNLTTTLVPSAVVVSNQTANYSLGGSGSLSGLGGLVKDGAATLTIANAGLNDFAGGVTLANGTVRIGTGGTGGNLPNGNVLNNGALVFSRSDNLTETLNISGTGSVTQDGAGVLTLGGSSTYEGLTTILQGTLKAASATAFGSNTLGVLVSSGATLDVNGQNLTPESVQVSGVGVDGLGAIVNSGAEQQNALLHVTLANHTTFGGTGRWDIRGSGPTLSTGGNPYNLTKVGTNQFTLVGTTVDDALANIDVQAGTFAAETTTSSLGNPANTLTVRAGATLQFYNSTTAWNKNFVLNGNGTNATVNVPSGPANTIVGPITLAGACIINNGTTDDNLTLNGAISGTGSLTKSGGSVLAINGVASYSGGTIVNGGTLLLNTTITGGGALSNAPGTAISGLATNIGPVQVNGALFPAGTNTSGFFGCGALTLNSAQLTFDLATPDITTQIASDQIVSTGSLTANGTTAITLSPGLPGSLTNGQVITLIKYNGGAAPTAAAFALQATPAGYSFSLIDPATTPNEVRIRINSAPQVLAWRGGAVSNPAVWDIAITPNWTNTAGTAGMVTFTNMDGVIFDDLANTNRVTLGGPLQPGSIRLNNFSLNYLFDGPGSLNGPTPLDLSGSGRLTIANSGSNSFSGPISINAGILQVGDGSTNGTLGSGVLTNNSFLVFTRAGTNLNVTRAITGYGTVTNNGSGVVTLSGANTYDGETIIAQGTLKAGSATALGSSAQGTTILPGATLDIGGQSLTNEPVTVSGTGVGGQGAIISSGAQQLYALANVTLAGNTTFGGTGRWDIRASFGPSLSTFSQPYSLTKVGPNSVWLVNASVDPALANISVQGGVLGYQEATSGLGNPLSILTIASGAGLGFYNATVPLDKVIVLNGSGTNNTVDVGNGIANAIAGSVTLNGTCIFSASSGTMLSMNGTIGGAGNLTKVGAGTLALTSGAELATTPVITVSAGVLDVTGLTAGPNLVLRSGQKLAGSGSINGSVQAQSGSTVAPGSGATGVLTVSNNVQLDAGSATMIKLDRAAALKSDRLNAATITLGGSLVLTNIGGILQTGDTFTLLSTPLSGSFGSVVPPALWPGLSLNTSTLDTAGTVSITGTMIPPQVTGGISGPNFVLTASGGLAGATCYVVASTNVALPIASWSRVATNAFGASGMVTISVPINPANPNCFYRLQVP